MSTFVVNYLQEFAAIALRARLLVVKNFHFANVIAAAIGIDYAKEFPVTLTDDDVKEIVNVYGTSPMPGKFPRGWTPNP